MKVLEGRNDVKIYCLSSGKTVPDWLTRKKRRKLMKQDGDLRHRIELIHDFTMPDFSTAIKLSRDGNYLCAIGGYTPRVRCFETRALSLKFERCMDTECINVDILSEDFSKLVFLQEDRYLEFHYQGGRWFRTRVPMYSRDFAYHYPSCDLYITTAGSQIYRLNLELGCFMTPMETSAPSLTKCVFNPEHYLFACGTVDGWVEAWDPRSRHRVGRVDCAMHMIKDTGLSWNTSLEVTSLAFDGALSMAVGTHTGQVLMYDIRSHKPLLVKDHLDGLPIIAARYPTSSRHMVSLAQNVIKIWDRVTGKPLTSIDTPYRGTDMCVVPDSGMIFLTGDGPDMHTYFIPSLGPAPRWAGHIDALIEELEEEELPATYDDYKFVTDEELVQLGLENLIGTPVLRAYMHGYYMDLKLYNRAKSMVNPFNFNDFVKKRVKEKITEENKRTIRSAKAPEVNRELYETLLAEKKSSRQARAALADKRFGELFSKSDFTIDYESKEYKRTNPSGSGKEKKKKTARDEEQEEEDEYLETLPLEPVEPEESEAESVVGVESLDRLAKKKNKQDKKRKKKRKRIQVKEKMMDGQKYPWEVCQGADGVDVMGDMVSVGQLNAAPDTIRKEITMTVKDRLKAIANYGTVKEEAFGSREISWVVRDKDDEEEMEKKRQLKEHRKERREFARPLPSTKLFRLK